MESTAGMKPTGRRISGPAFDLVELESDKGLKFTAIGYHDEFKEHPALLADLKEFGRFMERPNVPGLVELLRRDDKAGLYAYPTGTAWSVAEIVRSCADQGETAGIRAGLELAYLAAQILQEAEEAGAKVQLYNHGSLSPWHLAIKPDGSVLVIGYGLPQVEVIDFLEDETLMPKEDSFRYAPPERLADEGEDLSSDLFVLALIALELMTGRPVYDGLINDIRQQATRAEGAYRLYKWRNVIPSHVSEALGRALKFDPDARYPTATDFVYAMHDLLGLPDIEGPSLAEVIKRFKHADKKGQPVMGGRTAALTKEELARLAAELDDDEPVARKLAPPKRPRPGADPEPEPEQKDTNQRWGKSTRSPRADHKRDRPARSAADRAAGATGAPPAAAASPLGRSSAGSKDDLRERLRSGRSSGPPSRAEAPEARKEDLRSSLRDSLGSRRPPSEAAAPPPSPPSRPPEPPPEENVMGGEDEKASGAAALLARLRSSSGKKPAPGEGPPRGPDPTARAPSPAPTAPPVAPSRAPTPGPAPAATPSRPAAAPSASGARRSIRMSRRDYENDEKVPFDVLVVGSTKVRKTKLRLGDPLSDTADRLAHALAVVPTDLAGNLKGWYRVEQAGEWFPGHETADVLDPSKPVTLAFVPNRILPITIEVEGVDPPARFQAPVGTAVPSRSLVQHVVETLGLPDAEWAAYVDDRQMEPLQILEDFEPGPGTRVVVKK